MERALTSLLRAEAKVALAGPVQMMDKLCEHFIEHGIVDRPERYARLEFAYGTASMEADRDSLHLRAEGSDATNLAYVKLSLAEHILAFAEGEAPRIAWSGDGAAGAPLPSFREMRVVGASSITPRMRRVRL